MKRVLLLAALACAVTAPAAQAGVLDQQQTTTGTFRGIIDDGISQAQTFTAGITGSLDQVDLDLSKFPTVTEPLNVKITATINGAPTGAALASASIPAASVVDSPAIGWIQVPIGPMAVTAGTLYAIVLTTTGDEYYIGLADTNVYAGGAQFVAIGSGPFVPPPEPHDLTFKTYVVAGTPVLLRSVSAVRTRAGALIRWRTASELGVLGFNVYRIASGRRVRLNRAIIRAAQANAGRAYRFMDGSAAKRKGLRYSLELVRLDGSRSSYRVPYRIRRT